MEAAESAVVLGAVERAQIGFIADCFGITAHNDKVNGSARSDKVRSDRNEGVPGSMEATGHENAHEDRDGGFVRT
jgi:hypothetical protein